MEQDVPTLLAIMQAQIQAIRDLALIAPQQQKLHLSQTANLFEACIREYDRQAD